MELNKQSISLYEEGDFYPRTAFIMRSCNQQKSLQSDFIHMLQWSVFYFSVRSVMHKHLMKMGEVTFDKIFNQKLGECQRRLLPG